MSRPFLMTTALLASLVLWHSSARAENEGQADLDKATELQLSADSLNDLEKVADLAESAISKGLDEGNKEFATQLLTSTLYAHASRLSEVIFGRGGNPMARPQIGPREALAIRDAAIADLERAFKYNNDLPDAHLLAARLYAIGVDRDKALASANKAVELLKDDAEKQSKAYLLRGVLQKEADDQIADYSKAAELDPKNADAWRARGLSHLTKGENEKAAADFQKMVEADDDNVQNITLLVDTLTTLKKYDEATKLVEKLIETNPKASLGYTARARLRSLQGKDDEALEDLNKALELSPTDVAALLMRARHHYTKKETEKAKADVDRALEIRPGLVQAIMMQAVLAAEQGDMKQAIENMQLLVNADPANPEWKLQLAQFLSADKRPRKAIETVNEVLEDDKENSVALRIRGDAYLSIGKHKEAVADLEAALKNDPKNSGILNNLAWVLSTSPDDDVRDGKRAVELATKACEETEYKRPHILSTLAAAYAETGDFETAIKWSTKAVEMSAGDEVNKEVQEQLKQELDGYKEKKPFRERQETEEKSEPKKPSPDDLEI